MRESGVEDPYTDAICLGDYRLNLKIIFLENIDESFVVLAIVLVEDNFEVAVEIVTFHSCFGHNIHLVVFWFDSQEAIMACSEIQPHWKMH